MMASSKKPAPEKSTPETTPQPSKHPWESPEPTPPQNPAEHPPNSSKPFDPLAPAEHPTPKTQPVAQDDVPVNLPPDPLQPVDCASIELHIGDYVYIPGVIVGIRADVNNRLNLWISPAFDAITCNDPNNPLIKQVDGKAILVSGYNCWTGVNPSVGGNLGSQPKDVIPPITEAILQQAKDAGEVPLPSNFLAPSLL